MRKISILVIEDNEPDFIILEKALKKIKDINIDLHHVTNGQEGIEYIFKENKYINAKTPDIVILDLNLPIKTGFEVLNMIKTNDKTRIIPVIIYSSSKDSDDIHHSYYLYANSYICKSFDIKEIFKQIKTFSNYWLEVNEIPTHNDDK